MEPVEQLVMTLASVGLGVVLRLMFRAKPRKGSRSPKVWREAAEELGLHWHTGHRASGWVGEDWVLIEADDARTWVTFELWPPLDLRLDAIHSNDTVPSVNEYPDWLMARCLEPERLGKFFTPQLREALVGRFRKLGVRFVLSDARFSVVDDDVVERGKLLELVKGASVVADAIRSARAQVQVPFQFEAVLRDWETQVGQRGFVETRTPIGMVRDTGDVRVRCFLRRRNRTSFVVASAEHSERAPLGFVTTSRWSERVKVPWSMQFLYTGDEDFDRVFTVRALSPEHVERSLTEHARRTLCEVARSWPNVRVDHRGASIEVPLRGDVLVEQLMDAAQQIAEEFLPQKSQTLSAYR